MYAVFIGVGVLVLACWCWRAGVGVAVQTVCRESPEEILMIFLFGNIFREDLL